MRKVGGGAIRGSKSQIKFNKMQAEKEKEAIRKLNWHIFKHNLWILNIFYRKFINFYISIYDKFL